MRCECCDKELTPAEDSAMFKEPDGTKPHRRVSMCSECRSFLPREVSYVQKRDATPQYTEPRIFDDRFDPTEYGDDDESW